MPRARLGWRAEDRGGQLQGLHELVVPGAAGPPPFGPDGVPASVSHDHAGAGVRGRRVRGWSWRALGSWANSITVGAGQIYSCPGVSMPGDDAALDLDLIAASLRADTGDLAG